MPKRTDTKKHGHWIIDAHSRKFQHFDGTEAYENVHCSVCYKWGVTDFAYCPHCGAKMDDKDFAHEERERN